MPQHSAAHHLRLLVGLCLATVLLSGCATMPGWMPASGASREQVMESPGASSNRLEGITLLDVDDALTKRLMENKKTVPFSKVFASARMKNYPVGPGDIIEISIWEASPAMLFGGTAFSSRAGAVSTRAETLPPQMVMEDGNITMPFVGRVLVRGRAAHDIEADIAKRLQGQANQPQVVVRVMQNTSTNVTVIGDVAKSTQMPLTPKGERLLDALAVAGGVTQPVTRMSVQLSRAVQTAVMPLDVVIRDPAQNIPLLPGDVITALFQPQTFSVLGAVGKSQEIPFEAQGISLAQALARSGGLDDNKADARGVFVFRFEDATLLGGHAQSAPDVRGKVPVIYQVNLRDPASFFVTQNFPVQDRDVIYVANAPAAELEKFLRMVGQVLAPAVNMVNVNRTITTTY